MVTPDDAITGFAHIQAETRQRREDTSVPPARPLPCPQAREALARPCHAKALSKGDHCHDYQAQIHSIRGCG